MSTVFALLSLASLVCLVIGLVKPAIFGKVFKKYATRGKLSLILTGGFILFIILAGVTTPKTDKPSAEQTATTAPPTATPAPSYSFDVPSLIGKNVDEIRQVLGAPIDQDLAEPSAEQRNLGVDEWDNSFRKDGHEILVTFNPNTRKVIDYFLSGDVRDKLLEIGNLKSSDSKYNIESVKSFKDSSAITGIKITPKL